jgi:pyrimidine operon attenuation protein/uracil phosphoribosyltransferase
MKTEIYTLRLSRDLKEALESEARRRKVSIAALLDRGARQLLQNDGERVRSDDAEQLRLHAQARKSIGAIAGVNPLRAESARLLIRERLARKHGN